MAEEIKSSKQIPTFIKQPKTIFTNRRDKGTLKSLFIFENMDNKFNQTLSQTQKAVREISMLVYL